MSDSVRSRDGIAVGLFVKPKLMKQVGRSKRKESEQLRWCSVVEDNSQRHRGQMGRSAPRSLRGTPKQSGQSGSVALVVCWTVFN